jgi:hypothetical protein
VACIACFALGFIFSKPKEKVLELVKTEIVYDTVLITKTDTLTITNTVYLSDTTKQVTSVFEDENIAINVQSILSFNSDLLRQDFSYTLKMPQQIITNTYVEKYNCVYAGIAASRACIMPKITYVDKKNNMYSVGYTTNGEVMFGYQRALFKW